MKSNELKEIARINKKDFTRDRKIGFFKLMTLILVTLKRTGQFELDQLLKNYGFKKEIDMTYTKQAYSESRQKLSEKAFIALNDQFIEKYYSDGDFIKYKKYILMAIDGCVHEIPNTPELQAYFGFSLNGTKDFKIARALTASLYDVENKLLVTSVIERCDGNERENAKIIIENALKLIPEKQELLIVFDRGYPSMEFIEWLRLKKVHFLMRVSSSFCKEVVSTKSDDELVDIEITKDRIKNFKKQVTYLCEGMKIKVRVIKILLESREVETLITDIVKEELPYNEIKKLYFKRWKIETKFDELKNKFQIENYTGEKPLIIKQDFYSTMFLSNLASVLEQDASEVAQEKREGKSLKYDEYRINKSILIGKVKCDLFEILLAKDDEKKDAMFEQLINEISRNIVPYIGNKKAQRNTSKKTSNKYSRARKRSY